MGDIKKLFKTDENMETSGIWSEDIGGGIKVKVARFNNTNHKRTMEMLMKPHQAMLRNKNMSEELAEQLLAKGMARSILLDWEGVEEDGRPLPYNVKNAERLLLELKDFRDFIHGMSTTMEIYKMQEEEETEKNSEPTSTGQ